MQSRNINGYPQQQSYGDDSTWMETKAQQLQTQQSYGDDSHGWKQPQSAPNYHGHDSIKHVLDSYHVVYLDSKPHGLDSNHDVYHRQDKVPYGQRNGYGYDSNHGHGNGNGQIFPFGATTNHSPHHGNGVRPFNLGNGVRPFNHGNGVRPFNHGNGVRPFNHGGRGRNDYVSKNEYEVYKEECVGPWARMWDEMRYERRGRYGGDVSVQSIRIQ